MAPISEAVFNFDRIRILGVMPRLALCYGIGATIAVAEGSIDFAPRTGVVHKDHTRDSDASQYVESQEAPLRLFG